MFSRKDYTLFILSLTLILAGYLCMAFDPAENGFGLLTLWIAPPMLLIGFLIPIPGILGADSFFRYRTKLNTPKHLFGFMAFTISLITYLLTLEPTASLWDCSEFIAAAYKLQVPHTPGTPLSLLIARIFTMLAEDSRHVALSVNAMSGIFSALTIYLVYHIIYLLGEHVVKASSKNPQTGLILASLGGSLCLTFSDTFWFSAVEAETYGVACFFLMLIVLLILSGKDLAQPRQSRWLVLIFYVGGLSYCIHPMCVLAIPILPFAWYSSTRKLTFKNIVFPVLAGFTIVLIINRIVSIGLFELGFSFDRFFVNSMHLPFYSGAIILCVLIGVAFVVLIKKYTRFAPYTWAVVFLLLGFTPYLMLFIRSNHNPPIDETNPENLAMIKAYMNRESYGSSPLLYGPYFDAQIDKVGVKKNIYHPGKDAYEFSGTMSAYHYDPKRSTILPRMYSNDASHIESYRSWAGLKKNEVPAFSDNLRFMFEYQLGHMYLRYLMFNFAGRESDHQNDSWLTPMASIQETGKPAYKNKAHNQYWMLPLMLGLLGMIIQFRKDIKGFISTVLFFLITGIILALYLNSPPIEPRERDYIYVGSFIAFVLWIGLGILGIFQWSSRFKTATIITAIVGIGVPFWMFYQTYDDHNRSGRTFQVDNARNMLSSCAPNSILFTGGDNDTFPLWYVQEVEGFRTDVRVMVLSYLNTDWYIGQLRKKYYDSDAFALTLTQEDYRQYGPNDVLYVQESIKDGIDFQKYLTLLKEEHPALRAQSSTGDFYTILPSKILKLKVDTGGLADNSFAKKASLKFLPEMSLEVDGNFLQKNGLAILDLLVSNAWKRPMYFNFTSLNTAGLALENRVVQEGNVYRLLPVENRDQNGAIDKTLMYKNLIVDADYSNLKNDKLYFNYEDFQARMISPVRQSLNTLAIAYLQDGDLSMADSAMQFTINNLYLNHLLPSYSNLQAADIMLALDKEEQAKSLCRSLFDFHFDKLQSDMNASKGIDRMDIFLATQSAEMLSRLGDTSFQLKMNSLGFKGAASAQ